MLAWFDASLAAPAWCCSAKLVGGGRDACSDDASGAARHDVQAADVAMARGDRSGRPDAMRRKTWPALTKSNSFQEKPVGWFVAAAKTERAFSCLSTSMPFFEISILRCGDAYGFFGYSSYPPPAGLTHSYFSLGPFVAHDSGWAWSSSWVSLSMH
ncbi:hypothetical protein ACQJBY_052660 [Aegilops geniculata]